MHRAPAAGGLGAGWVRPGRRRGQRGGGGGAVATNGRGTAANGLGAAGARPGAALGAGARAVARVGLLVAFACLAAGMVLLLQNPQAFRGSPIELAVRRAAAVAAELASASAAASGGGGGVGGSGIGAADLPLPPLLQFRRDKEGQALFDERRRSEDEARQPRTTTTQERQQQTTTQQMQPAPLAATTTAPASSSSPLRHAIWWLGPIFSASGYGTEAIDFLLALARDGGLLPPSNPAALAAAGPLRASHHGDNERPDVVAALSQADRADLLRMAEAPKLPTARLRPAIVVCHSFASGIAGASAEWARWRRNVERVAAERGIPTGLPPGDPCPPDPRRHAYDYVVLRTMYETHVPPPGTFVRKCNSANEVWVPTRWGVEAFVAGGVDRGKLRAVPEGVNTTFFDPNRPGGVQPMDLAATGRLVFGRGRAERAAAANATAAKPFVFLSSFKWEPRKGWDVLLHAFLTEFLAEGESNRQQQQHPNVELHILTRPYAGNGDFAGQMRAWADAQLVPLVPGRDGDGASASEAAAAEGVGSEAAAEGGDGGSKAVGAAAGATAATATMTTAAAAITKALLPAAAAGMGGGAGSRGGGGGGAHNDDDGDDEDPAQQRPKQQPQQPTAAPRAPNAAAAAAAVPPPYRRFPAVYVHTQHISDLTSIYSAADAFVLPSRGEGWGRPHVEAMAMALPVIATNWSGPVEFLDEHVGYPIAIEGLDAAEGGGGGALKWARPSVPDLRRLMRRVVERPGEAKALGAEARGRMVERYSPAVIARVLEAEFRRIEEAMP